MYEIQATYDTYAAGNLDNLGLLNTIIHTVGSQTYRFQILVMYYLNSSIFA